MTKYDREVTDRNLLSERYAVYGSRRLDSRALPSPAGNTNETDHSKQSGWNEKIEHLLLTLTLDFLNFCLGLFYKGSGCSVSKS